MRRHLLIGLTLLMGLGGTPAHAALNVFTCEPEWAALAKELGADDVDTYSASTAVQDVHKVQPRPSLIAKYRQADLVVCTGAELEVGWLPPLLEGARNSKILAGGPGRIVASEGVQLLDIPLAADRSQGDTHVAGNPHFMLDPLNAKIVAEHIARVFSALDAPGAATYQANLAKFDSTLDAKMAEWTTPGLLSSRQLRTSSRAASRRSTPAEPSAAWTTWLLGS